MGNCLQSDKVRVYNYAMMPCRVCYVLMLQRNANEGFCDGSNKSMGCLPLAILTDGQPLQERMFIGSLAFGEISMSSRMPGCVTAT